MNSARGSVAYGSSYAPLAFPESAWQRDLELMAAAQMNLVRIGDVGTWDRVEAQQGVYQLDTLQRFYSLSQQYGIQVLLSTGTSSPPLWLAKRYPDVVILSSRGEKYPLGASYHWACVHHPAYQDACRKYIHRLAEFALQQPNHFGWQISNEIGFPFNPTREAGDIDLYCYCDHSKRHFQNWLQEKYGDLERLTHDWSWSTTNFVYNAWEDTFPPEALPKVWSGVTRWIDWRLFWQQAFTDHARWEHETIREIDRQHPTSVNTFNFKSYDRFGTYTGLDQWKLSEAVDHIGYDLYPGSGDKLSTRPEHNSIFLDHGRSVSYFAGSDLWLHEIESGPIGGWLMGPEHNTGPKDILTMSFEALGHDGKLLVYMPWREWTFQPLHWGALIDLQGNPTPRYQAAARVGEYLRQQGEFLRRAHVPKGEIAILEDKANAIFLRGIGNEESLFNAQRGAYCAFWEQDYRVDFITPPQLLASQANDYRLICLPLLGILSTETAMALQAYVAQGGVLVGFARCGTLDERGWYHPKLPLPGLAQAFGLRMVEADTLQAKEILYGEQRFRASLNRDLIEVASGTRILATFEDGAPAVTLAQHGKGFGVYIATQADAGYLAGDGKLLGKVVTELHGLVGIEPHLTIHYPQKQRRELDAHILVAEDRSELILTNYLEERTRLVVRLKENRKLLKEVYLEFEEQKPVDYVQNQDAIEIQLEVEPKQIQVAHILWNTIP